MPWISEDQTEGQKLKIVLQNSLSECLKIIKVQGYQYYFGIFQPLEIVMEMKVQTAAKI